METIKPFLRKVLNKLLDLWKLRLARNARKTKRSSLRQVINEVAGEHVVAYEKITSLGYRTTITLEEGIDELVRGLQVLDVRNPYSNV